MNKKPLIVSLLKLFLLKEQNIELQRIGDFIHISLKKYSNEELLKKLCPAQVLITKNKIINYDFFYKLQNKLIVIPFGKKDFLKNINHKKLKKNNITILHLEREYKQAVSEWILFMMLALSRKFHLRINTANEIDTNLKMGISLLDKNVTILGKGVIGSHIGKILNTFGMNVTYFKRNDDIYKKIKDADFIVNCLKNNIDNKPILDKSFFSSISKKSFFISAASNSTYDIQALKDSILEGKIIGFADDIANAHIGNSDDNLYKTIKQFPNTIVTPHIAWRTDMEAKISYDKLINAIKNYLKE